MALHLSSLLDYLYVVRRDLPRHVDQEALPGVLVDDVQHPVGSPVACPVRNEVVAPDVIGVRCPHPYAGCPGEP